MATFNGRRAGLCIFTSRTAWNEARWMATFVKCFPLFLKNLLSDFSISLIVSYYYTAYLIHTLRLINYHVIFQKYFAKIQEKLYRY